MTDEHLTSGTVINQQDAERRIQDNPMSPTYSLQSRGFFLSLLNMLWALALVIGITVFVSPTWGEALDFVQDYQAGRLALSGKSIYSAYRMSDVFPEQSYPNDSLRRNYHTPFSVLLVLPFALMPYQWASWCWTGLNALLYLWLWKLLVEEAHASNIARKEPTNLTDLPDPAMSLSTHRLMSLSLLGATLGLLWFPVWIGFFMGQFSVFMAICLVGCRWCLGRGRELPAGILLGLACLVKLFPLLLIVVLLLRGRWRAVLAAGLTLGVGVIAGILVFGSQESLFYAMQLLPEDAALMRDFVTNISLASMVTRLSGGTRWEMILALGLNMVLFAGLVRATIVWAKDRSNDLRLFDLGLCMMILLSPISWSHALVMVLPPLISLIQAAWKQRKGVVVWLALGILVGMGTPIYPTLADVLASRGMPQLMAQAVFNVATLALLGLSWTVWRRIDERKVVLSK